jgi:hypothetical protein
MTSTAELTSDTGLTSPPRSATPSPPAPSTRQTLIPTLNVGKEELPLTRGDSNEVLVEKTLGRKRCIMFAFANAPEKATEPIAEPKKEVPATVPTKRPCMLRFSCPSRENKSTTLASEVLQKKSGRPHTQENQLPSPVVSRTPSSDSVTSTPEEKKPSTDLHDLNSSNLSPTTKQNNGTEQQSITSFHEFGSSTDEPDAWVTQRAEHQSKLTMTDCLRKELALRQIGEEAEQEAEQEEEEQNELEDEDANNDNEDDFAPSDGSSDAGNESDDEEGFADSDDESDAESDYEFWAPSKAASMMTAATSNDNLTIGPVGHIRASNSQRHSIASSLESGPPSSFPHQYPPMQAFKHIPKRRSARISKMRPSTPELPDSTDFVCGTFDEDRPLEAAYISCREQKKREKHVPVPQDIDPSFPTTDPEDKNETDDDAATEEEDDHLWLKDQLEGFDDEAVRSRRRASTVKKSPPPSPRRYHSPPPKGHVQRPAPIKHNTNRSPPPRNHIRRPSPAPGRLFGRSPTRLGSPPPPKRLRSPRGSPQLPLGITITRLAQRPNSGRTASLPHTPNPFFRNYKMKTPRTSNFTSGAVSPDALSEVPDHQKHVRGAVDIVIGLEKKRQKRKEKFWRQHCRKAAKEQAERKPAPGRGVERMKELGLECAERTKAYGLGQPAQLVISL